MKERAAALTLGALEDDTDAKHLRLVLLVDREEELLAIDVGHAARVDSLRLEGVMDLVDLLVDVSHRLLAEDLVAERARTGYFGGYRSGLCSDAVCASRCAKYICSLSRLLIGRSKRGIVAAGSLAPSKKSEAFAEATLSCRAKRQS